jgi:hypothetical protein
MRGTHAAGDGTPSAVALIVGRGSRGGSASPSRVAPVKGIHQGEEYSADAAHGAVHPIAEALPSIEPSQEDGSEGWHRTMATAASSVDGASGASG